MVSLVIAGALRDAAQRLAAVSDTPRLDAELLMAYALGIVRERLLLDPPNGPVPAAFETLLARRLDRYPVAHLIGTRDFWTLSLAVTPDVLVPRPDSETLIEVAIAHFGDGDGDGDGYGPRRILDLGTGSGALLLAALDHWPDARGEGIDISPAAVAVAQGNAVRTGLAGRAVFRIGAWEDADTPADLILCNPPYVERDAALAPEVLREPHGALFAGADGLDDYRRIVPLLPRLMAPGGIACLEIGSEQAVAVCALAAAAGLGTTVHRDLGGRDRCVAAQG